MINEVNSKKLFSDFVEASQNAKEKNIKIAALLGKKQQINLGLECVERNKSPNNVPTMANIPIFFSDKEDLLDFFEFGYKPIDKSKEKIDTLKEAIKILINE